MQLTAIKPTLFATEPAIIRRKPGLFATETSVSTSGSRPVPDKPNPIRLSH